MLLDANAVLAPFRSGLALAAEVERLRPGAELVVPSSVLRELDRLAARGVRSAGAARDWARSLPIAATAAEGDAAIVERARALPAWVVTADAGLAARLLSVGVPVLVPRDRTRLTLRRPPGPPARAPRRRRSGRGNGYEGRSA